MADRRILEKFRKPRKAKGTPFYVQRNYYALAVLGVGALSWMLYELSPAAKKLRTKQLDGAFNNSEALESRIAQIRLSRSSASMEDVIIKARERILQKDEESKPQPWYYKYITKEPEVSNTLEKISSYFGKAETSNDGRNHISDIESPYRDVMSEIKVCLNDSTSEESDFKTPKPMKKFVITKDKKQIKTRGKKRSTQTRLNIIDCAKPDLDVNLDHLQMAVALSKSSYESENPDKKLDDDNDSMPLKFGTLKTTLEQFGFKASRSTIGVESKRVHQVPPKRRKPSKFKYITPTLLSRTPEERESLISSKISLILTQQTGVHNTEVKSIIFNLITNLKEFINKESSIFERSNINLELQNDDLYYVQSLKLPFREGKCGSLLKYWSKIPGRELSPLRKTEITDVDIPDNQNVVLSTENKDNDKPNSESLKECTTSGTPSDVEVISSTRSISPDLFGSDDESTDYFHLSPKITNYFNESSQSILNMSPSKSKGLLKRSPCKTPIETCSKNKVEVHDLTLSSDEEDLKDSSLSQQVKENEVRSNTDTTTTKVYDLTISSDEETANDDLKVVDLLSKKESISPKTTYSTGTGVTHFESYSKDLKVASNYYSLDSSDCEDDYLTKIKDLCTQSSYGMVEDVPNNKNKPVVASEEMENNDSLTVQEYSISSNRELSIDGNASYAFNCTKSLNVTDYLTQMLNENSSFINSDKNEIKHVMEVNTSQRNTYKETVSDSDESLHLHTSQTSSQGDDLVNDEELNYSCNYGTPYLRKSELDIHKTENESVEMDSMNSNKNTEAMMISLTSDDHDTPLSHVTSRNDRCLDKTAFKSKRSLTEQFLEDSFNKILEDSDNLIEIGDPKLKGTSIVASKQNTPTNIIIKKDNVTPMLEYDSMDTPTISKQLGRFGLKPLKRQRGAKLLKHIYESTHPIVGTDNGIESEIPPSKKRKTLEENEYEHINTKAINTIVNNLLESEAPEDLIFERKQSARIPSCRIPLQIVWHNFVSNNPDIFENILLYEPLQLEVLHKMLKEQGFKFHIQDLLTFLDRKCITIRTAQGNQNIRR